MSLRSPTGLCGVVRLVLAVGLVAVQGVSAGAADDARGLTESIDRLIRAQWDENRVVPAPLASDGEFIRRASLDLIGKIPSSSEVSQFLDDSRADKREKLVERLLDSPAYIAHFTGVEMRLLIPEVDSSAEAQVVAPAFEAWLREQVTANAGSDRIVNAILTAPIADNRAEAQNSQTTPRNRAPTPLPFYVAKDVKSENLAASTARLFLGLRLECAQCHNHPFASWTRDQFWGYAAFFASLEKRPSDDGSLDPIREQPDRREVTIPGSEKVVRATFLDGSSPQFRPPDPARRTLAEWMTATDNPYFARAAVNRIWAQFFGIGLVDPVDDMGTDNPPSHPELLDILAKAFAERGFDRKFLIRAITLSRPYQLTSHEAMPNANPITGTDDPRLFARMRERGLTAEQLYDSLAQAIGSTVEEASPGRFAGAVSSSRAEFLEKFGHQDERPTEAQTSILQALALMNGRLVAGATHIEGGTTLSAVAEAPFLDTAGRVETLFLATLSRRPSSDEVTRLGAYVEKGGPTGDRRKALSDVFWALLNSPEFLLNH